MNETKYARLIATAILATAASGLANTVDITGLNLWGQFGDPQPIRVTTDKAASGNGSMVFDAAEASGASVPQVVFASPIVGGIASFSIKAYFPTGSKFGFLYGADDGNAGDYVQISSYANDHTGGFGQIEDTNVGKSAGGYSFIRDQWKTLKFVINLNTPGVAGNGKFYYDDMVNAAGTFTYGSDTITEFWFVPSTSYTGTVNTGPFYFDDMVVTQDSNAVWSDNFDRYIPNADLISIDVVANGSVAVSGNVAGGLACQSGLWNALPLSGGKVTLSDLTDGAGTSASGVGFVFDSASVGYHVQSGGSPFNPGVVLSAGNPERSWVTGGETPVTFKFTGLTADANYSLAIFTSGDPLMTLTVNGTPTLNPGEIFTSNTTADANGNIVCQVSCGGGAYADYAEIAGIQLLKLATAPAPPALVAHAGTARSLSPVSPSATLGASPAATGGTGPYTYAWSPSTGLNDATLANPTVTTTEATTTYTLTVTDSLLVTARDTVIVTFTVPALVASAGADKSVSAGTPSVVIGGSPSASGGSGTYFYSWSPSTGLSDVTLANPTASPTETTVYTLTVTDSLGTPESTSSMTVTYVLPPTPNANLISVDFVEGSGTPCSGDTIASGTLMKNAVGISFTGQAGSWNRLNIGSYNNGSATSGFLNNGAGTATTVKLLLGSATGIANPGGWRCNPNEGALGGASQLRSEEAYLYNGVVTGDHYVWAFTGLTPNASYKMVWFGDIGNASGASNVANSVAGSRDSEGDWNWDTVSADADGKIIGLFTAPNPTLGLYGAQIEAVGPPPSGYDTWAATNAGGQTAGEDFNHDGVANGIAYFMGETGRATNPGVVNGKVTWPHVNAVSAFEVQVSTNLIDWTSAASGVDLSNPAEVVYTLPTGTAREFCRLVVTP